MLQKTPITSFLIILGMVSTAFAASTDADTDPFAQPNTLHPGFEVIAFGDTDHWAEPMAAEIQSEQYADMAAHVKTRANAMIQGQIKALIDSTRASEAPLPEATAEVSMLD